MKFRHLLCNIITGTNIRGNAPVDHQLKRVNLLGARVKEMTVAYVHVKKDFCAKIMGSVVL